MPIVKNNLQIVCILIKNKKINEYRLADRSGWRSKEIVNNDDSINAIAAGWPSVQRQHVVILYFGHLFIPPLCCLNNYYFCYDSFISVIVDCIYVLLYPVRVIFESKFILKK